MDHEIFRFRHHRVLVYLTSELNFSEVKRKNAVKNECAVSSATDLTKLMKKRMKQRNLHQSNANQKGRGLKSKLIQILNELEFARVQ